MTTTDKQGGMHIKCGVFQRQFTLSSPQKDILSKTDEQYVLVAGPPGSGKTTVLMCTGLQWLKQGKDVLVFSLQRDSVPTSWYVYTLLSEARKAVQDDDNDDRGEEEAWGSVNYNHHLLMDPDSVNNAVSAVQGFQSTRPMCLLMDYMSPDSMEGCLLALQFVKELKTRLPDVGMWISDWYSTVPEGFNTYLLDVPLRFTQKLFSLIKIPVDALEMMGKLPHTHNFNIPTQAPEGPDIIHLRHTEKGKGDKWPINCERCGREVAKILRHIGVGSMGKGGKNGSKGGYQFHDVLLITRNEVEGQGESPAFVRGLKSSGIPTKVFGKGDYLTREEALSNVILGHEDKVTVMNSQDAIGLDSKVVVCLTGAAEDESWEITEEEQQQIKVQESTVSAIDVEIFQQQLQKSHRSIMEMLHRLGVWVRCREQLIVVHLPESVEGLRDFEFYEQTSKCVIL